MRCYWLVSLTGRAKATLGLLGDGIPVTVAPRLTVTLETWGGKKKICALRSGCCKKWGLVTELKA